MKILRISYNRTTQILAVVYDDLSVRTVLGCASGFRMFAGQSWKRGGGPIPLSSEVAVPYSVETAGHMSEKCQSWMFNILPNPVVCSTDPALIRCDIGIHEDNPPIGVTSGCIGVSSSEWNGDESCGMASLRDEISESDGPLPLEVVA